MNTTENIKNIHPVRERYNLAPASNRIIARLIDFIIMISLSIGFACLIFFTDPGFKGNIQAMNITEPYRYFLFVIINTICFVGYFMVLPYFWKGQTLGLKTFKLAIYNVVFTHFFINIFKRELLVWVINTIINFILALTLFIIGTTNGSDNAIALIKQMYTYDSSLPYFTVAIIFITMYMVSMMLLILVVFSVAFNSKRQSLIDKISNTVTVKKIDVNGSDKDNKNINKKNKLPKRNFNLPGVILDNPNEEINGEEE